MYEVEITSSDPPRGTPTRSRPKALHPGSSGAVAIQPASSGEKKISTAYRWPDAKRMSRKLNGHGKRKRRNSQAFA
jgi:hypothetical protein